MQLDRLFCLISLAISAASGFLICQRRGVWRLGRFGPALAPAFLLILWFVFLGLGQFSGSLGAMGVFAAVPLAALAAYSFWKHKRCVRFPYVWTQLDWILFTLLLLLLFSFFGYDFECHFAVIGTYLRGNIPPCALNDPSRPIAYHALFDAAAALVARALGIGLDRGIDIVSGTCLAACLSCLQGISRVLFSRCWSRQAARVLCLFGFGPIYLNILAHPDWFNLHVFFHGLSAQSFTESVLRRPMGLNYVVFLFMLAACLPRFSSPTQPKGGSSGAVHPGWLLPCAFLIPQISEELTVFATFPVLWLCASKKLSSRWLFLWAAMMIAALPMSGIFRAVLSSDSHGAVPRIAIAWPPTLPNWRFDSDLPLLSMPAFWMLFTDLGPLFFAGLALGFHNERRRVIAILWAVGLALACGLTLNRWVKADMDRFLFYGTCSGFMLLAGWIEKLEEALERGDISRARFQLLSCLILVPALLGPMGYLVSNVFPRYENPSISRLAAVDRTELWKALSPVGPREQIATDHPLVAQNLVYAGFVVAAPMGDHDVWRVNASEMSAYLQSSQGLSPAWLFIPQGHPLLAGRREAGRFNNYVLVRNETR